MTKITSVYRIEDHPKKKPEPSSEPSSAEGCFEFERRQLPMAVPADRKITMVIDLRPRGLSYDHNILRAREIEEFAAKYHILSEDERRASLTCSRADFVSVLSQSVPCVGCRRSVERMYDSLQTSGHPTLDPVRITPEGQLTVTPAEMAKPPVVAALLYKHQALLTAVLDNQPRNKKSSRCTLHSLDSFRSRPFSDMWREVWSCMRHECREEIAEINTADLHRTMDKYLKKHKFCAECRTKVEKAFSLLVSDQNPKKEKGYVPALYANIKKCYPNKHIHLRPKTDFIDSLIRRAESELNGSHTRHLERHAKTLEIAQEEVLTCIGMFIYERLRRVHLCLKEEENAVQVLGAVAVHTLCRSFDTAIEHKRGISSLEILYNELTRAERAKKARQESKKLKKKLKKMQQRQTLKERVSDADERMELEFGRACQICGRTTNMLCGCVEDVIDSESDHDVSSLCSISGYVESLQEITRAVTDLVECDMLANDSNNDTLSDIGPDLRSFAHDNFVDVLDVVDNAKLCLTTCTDSVIESCSCIASNDTLGGQIPSMNADVVKCNDAGYGSESTVSLISSQGSSLSNSRDGSEVACSEGFCNHDDFESQSLEAPYVSHSESVTSRSAVQRQHLRPNATLSLVEPSFLQISDHLEPELTLQQMLDDCETFKENEPTSSIPEEVLLDFACRQQNIRAMRDQLRQDLRHRFAALCVKVNGAT